MSGSWKKCFRIFKMKFFNLRIASLNFYIAIMCRFQFSISRFPLCTHKSVCFGAREIRNWIQKLKKKVINIQDHGKWNPLIILLCTFASGTFSCCERIRVASYHCTLSFDFKRGWKENSFGIAIAKWVFLLMYEVPLGFDVVDYKLLLPPNIRTNVHTRSQEEWTFPWLFNKNTSTCW